MILYACIRYTSVQTRTNHVVSPDDLFSSLSPFSSPIGTVLTDPRGNGPQDAASTDDLDDVTDVLPKYLLGQNTGETEPAPFCFPGHHTNLWVWFIGFTQRSMCEVTDTECVEKLSDERSPTPDK